jgi:hypothetical protein
MSSNTSTSTRTVWGLDGTTPDDEMPTCPACGPAQPLHGQYYRHDEGDGYDLFDCPECGGEWRAEELDALSPSDHDAVTLGDREHAIALLADARAALATYADPGAEWDGGALARDTLARLPSR